VNITLLKKLKTHTKITAITALIFF